MAYIPDILDYKPFYIQADADEVAVNTTEWGMVAMVTPFPILPTPKEPYKNEWLDEHGDDEYNAQMFYEAMEMQVDFYIITVGQNAVADLVSQVLAFFDKIKQGEFKVYDSFTKIGRRKVRYQGANLDNFRERIKNNGTKASCNLSVTFKVNDPVTMMTFRNNEIVEA